MGLVCTSSEVTTCAEWIPSLLLLVGMVSACVSTGKRPDGLVRAEAGGHLGRSRGIYDLL
jgi:hypothetical protein